MAPVVTACLSPEKVALPRTVYDLIIDHLTYKSLVKISNWIWPKIEQEEFVKYQIWVSTKLTLYVHYLTEIFLVPRFFPALCEAIATLVPAEN